MVVMEKRRTTRGEYEGRRVHKPCNTRDHLTTPIIAPEQTIFKPSEGFNASRGMPPVGWFLVPSEGFSAFGGFFCLRRATNSSGIPPEAFWGADRELGYPPTKFLVRGAPLSSWVWVISTHAVLFKQSNPAYCPAVNEGSEKPIQSPLITFYDE